jgi:hypothetical protein
MKVDENMVGGFWPTRRTVLLRKLDGHGRTPWG